MKSKGIAYLLWLLSIFGWLGFHHFYLGRIFRGIIWIFTGGFFGIGSFIDLFTLSGAVENYNTKQELKTIRAATLANLNLQKKKAEEEEQQRKVAEQQIKAAQETVGETEVKLSSPIEPKGETKSPLSSISKIFSNNWKSILKFGIPLILIGILIKSILYFIQPDFSNPQKVMEKTEELWRKNDFKNYYKYLSEKSKGTYDSYDQFIELRSISDSVFKKMEAISISIDEVKMEGNENYKRYKIYAIDKDGDKIDTNTYYRTLFNENGKWKLSWSKELLKKASDLFEQGEFKKAEDIFYSALEIDPYSIVARTQIVWCYLRDAQRPDSWQDTCAFHLNYVLDLDSTDSDTYNTIGAFYSTASSYEKAVTNFVLAAEYSKDSAITANCYSNAAQNAKNYNLSDAESYLERSLQYNSNSMFTWQTYGDLLYNRQDYVSAKEKYLKAIDLVPTNRILDNHTLINLYGYYALTCKKLNENEEAEKYVLKCIRVYPDKTHPIFKQLNLL